MNKDLTLFPYNIQIANKLNSTKLMIRLQMLENAKEDDRLLNCRFMSHDAHFNNNGKVNKLNWLLTRKYCMSWNRIQLSSQCGVQFLHNSLSCPNSLNKMIQRYSYQRALCEHSEKIFPSRTNPKDVTKCYNNKHNSAELCIKLPNRFISRNSTFHQRQDLFLWNFLQTATDKCV